jgi:molybdopterin-binding protein
LAARLGEAEDAAKQARAQAPFLSVTIPARQSFWIRFPDGIKKTVSAGDILQGEVTMAVAADANLDFLCVPPHSLIWGKVLEASAPAEGTKVLRIRFFKILFTGGHTIPLDAHITDVAGEQPMVRVSPGGSLVIGEPVVADPRERKKTPLLKADMRLRIELDESATITEPPKFYLAGPGAWIKTLDTETGRGFEVTHVITGRSAEKMGLRVGDVLTSINGRSCAKMEFEDALAALYGTPGSMVKVVAAQKAADKPRTLELKRGVFYKDGVETPAPLPFEKALLKTKP